MVIYALHTKHTEVKKLLNSKAKKHIVKLLSDVNPIFVIMKKNHNTKYENEIISKIRIRKMIVKNITFRKNKSLIRELDRIARKHLRSWYCESKIGKPQNIKIIVLRHENQ